MLNHDKLYGMRAVRMVPYIPDDSEAVSLENVNILKERYLSYREEIISRFFRIVETLAYCLKFIKGFRITDC